MKIGFFEDVARLEVFGDKPRSRSLLVRYACYCCVAVRLFAHIKITKLRIALFPLRSKLERQFLDFVLRYFFPDPKPADADAAGGYHDHEGCDCNPGRDREHADGYNPVAGGPDQKQCPGADHDGCDHGPGRVVENRGDVVSGEAHAVEENNQCPGGQGMKIALEMARHDLVTLHGLVCFDGAAPTETWTLDTSRTIRQLDKAIASQTSLYIRQLEEFRKAL